MGTTSADIAKSINAYLRSVKSVGGPKGLPPRRSSVTTSRDDEPMNGHLPNPNLEAQADSIVGSGHGGEL